jgi:iron complex outermembrane receptor protein
MLRSIITAALGLAATSAAAAQPGRPAAPNGPTAAKAGLPDVVVTARLRPEDAQTIPSAVSVIGGDLIDRSYTVNTQQLSLLVPSLNYSSSVPATRPSPFAALAAASSR